MNGEARKLLFIVHPSSFKKAPCLPPEGVCAPLHTTDRPGTLPKKLTTTSYRSTSIRSSLTGWIGRFALGRKHSQAVSSSRQSYSPPGKPAIAEKSPKSD